MSIDRISSAGVQTNDLNLSLGGAEILKEIILTVPPGGSLSIIGPSGSGKTSLLRCLSGLQTPTSGSVRLKGSDGSFLEPSAVPIGFVFQDLGIFENSSVKQNIYLGAQKGLKGEFANEVVEILGIKNLMNRQVTSLSGGERQRVAIARALVRKPSILFLDEIFSNVDQRLAIKLELLLIDLQQRLGFTMIYVTHNLSSAGRIGDRIIYLQSGRIQQEGSLSDIYRNPATEDVLRFVAPMPPFEVILEDWLGAVEQLVPVGAESLLVRPEVAQVSRQIPSREDVIYRSAEYRRYLSGIPYGHLLMSYLEGNTQDSFVVVAPKNSSTLSEGEELRIVVDIYDVLRI